MATAMATEGGQLTINSLVLGTVHMYYEKLPKPDVIEVIETNFEEGEIHGAMVVLHDALGLEAPHGRQSSTNRTAVTAYAMDVYDTVAKLVDEGKLPKIVVSSDDLSRLPISKKKMDNAEVITVNCRLEVLESMIKEVVTKVNKINEKPSFANATPVPAVVVAAALGQQGNGAAAGGTGRIAGPLGGQGIRDRANLDKPTNEFQNVNNRRRQRKMNYGTQKIEDAGAEAAPIDVFVGNTNPRATEEIIKRVLTKCAEKMPDKPKLEILEVKLLTNPVRDPNPRFKSWMVRVPHSFKTLMEDDAFYPDGWSHRKYFPKRIEQERNVRQHLDPHDPVNMEIAQHGGADNTTV